MAILDDMFGNTEVDVDTWQKENDDKMKGGSSFLPEFRLKETKPDNIGLISFLNEGLLLKLHSLRYFDNGKERFTDVLCVGQGCPLCKGKAATKKAVYMVIDWLNSYTNKKNEVIAFPQVKLFVRGITTAKLINARKEKYGSLLNKKWEVRRDGEGFHTYYDILLEEKDVTYDLTETKFIPTESGDKEVLAIARPTDWPEAVQGSLYDKNKLRPSTTLDFNDPEHIKQYIQFHYLNAAPSLYGRVHVPDDKPKAEAPKQPASKSASKGSSGDLPF